MEEQYKGKKGKRIRKEIVEGIYKEILDMGSQFRVKRKSFYLGGKVIWTIASKRTALTFIKRALKDQKVQPSGMMEEKQKLNMVEQPCVPSQ